MERYTVLDHTADLMIKAFGETMEECFENAAYALFDLTVDLSTVDTSKQMLFTSPGRDDEEGLYSLLSDLLYYMEGERMVLKDFKIKFLDDEVECCALGEQYDESKHRFKTQIKAVTYHMMEIDRETPSVTVLFDV
jgi:SHS2 domain-containing protein